ncbi:hypothetical protein [Actinomadura algeriensis]|uniref:LPXTG-motif cell wall-anchored protein n=1 Tax=Actinomadura algeriensis TaxID=1679523 RepID=A0ABR9JQI5_9ACTN|nr:hypothetical protein [Actinomadura algeriensis]MBE1532834.1 hypothetical protein [Actinomadura algeriensis]
MAAHNPRKAAAVAVVWLLVGIAGLIGAVALAVGGVPDRLAEQRAIESAPACPAAPREPADCLWEQEFAISGIRLYEGRGSEITATLTDRAGGEWATEFKTNEPLLDDLDDGDPVKGTIWRGEVVEIAALGDVQDTGAAPAGSAESYAATVLFAGPAGLLMIVAGGWRLRRRAEPATPKGLAGLLWFTGIMAGATFPIGIVAATAEWPIPLIGAVWALTAVAVGGITAVAVRKSGDVSAALGGTGAPAP